MTFAAVLSTGQNNFIPLPEKVNNLAGNVTWGVMLYVSFHNEADSLR